MNNQNMAIAYEKEILQFWEQEKVNDKVNESKRGKEIFSWVEGPPYPTGEAHLGHLRNWAIKDAVFRHKRFSGFDVYTKDGYDVHGLPVEQKVQKELGIQDTKELKKYGEDKFILACRDYVARIINDMKGLRARYGLSISKDHYQTSHPDYISMAWRFFKQAENRNLLYKDYRCVAWSPGLETTLSDYEVKDSYAMLNDPSIYVRIKLLQPTNSGNSEQSKILSTSNSENSKDLDEYVVIWTTTPWTLEANLAIGVHRDFEYSKVKVEFVDGETCILIVASALVENCMATFAKSNPMKGYEEVEIVKGIDLEGARYEPIYPENKTQMRLHKDANYHRIVHADFVSLGGHEDAYLEKLERKSYKHSHAQDVGEEQEVVEEKEEKGNKKKIVDGTGLVHEAPAHGMEDFDLCRELGITEAYSIVGTKGEMIKESKWAGTFFKDADKEIIKHLVSSKQMLHYDYKEHKYPLCWRSKLPIVYRTTEQWYIKRSELIDEMIQANNENVDWYPKTAKGAFNNLLSNAGDWAISRQRFWGTPIPIFEHKDSGEYIVVGSKEELEQLCGKELEDVHKNDLQKVTIERDGKIFEYVNYTCDVWFDSGCASFASHYGEGLSYEQIIEKYYPLTWITEGEDQMRGWFSSLMNVGYLTTGKVPYDRVLFYRFVMDKDGVKMSKSIGNGISGNEAIEKWGSDRTRYYLLSKIAPNEQLNFNPEEFSIVDSIFNTIENIFKFTNSYVELYQSNLNEDVICENVEDVWILNSLQKTLDNINELMSNYRFDQAIKEFEKFTLEEYSKTYLKIVKERSESCDESLLKVFTTVNKNIVILLGMFAPFKAEQLYQQSVILFKRSTVFLEEFTPVVMDKNEHVVENFEVVQDIIQAILASREKAKIGVRWPLKSVRVLSSIDNVESKLKQFESLISNLTNIEEISYDTQGLEMSYNVKPNFASLKTKLGADMPKGIKAVNSQKDVFIEAIKNNESSVVVDDIEFDLEQDILKEMSVNLEYAITSKFGNDNFSGEVILDTYQDDELLEKGYIREIMRRIQDLRKDLGLEKSQRISLSLNGSDEYLIKVAQRFSEEIMNKVGADKMVSDKLRESKEDTIKDKTIVVSIE